MVLVGASDAAQVIHAGCRARGHPRAVVRGDTSQYLKPPAIAQPASIAGGSVVPPEGLSDVSSDVDLVRLARRSSGRMWPRLCVCVRRYALNKDATTSHSMSMYAGV